MRTLPAIQVGEDILYSVQDAAAALDGLVGRAGEGQPRLRADRLARRASSRRSWPTVAVDRIEVVSIDDGEVVLYWELPAKEASKLLRLLREDLVNLDADEFIPTWGGLDLEDLF